MQNQILLYVSAASDLMVERDGISRIVSEIPVDIGWRIVQSPLKEGPVELEAIATSDMHLLLLGGDVRAPIGQEWMTARRAGKRPLCYLKQPVNRTAAASDFQRFVGLQSEWIRYETANQLQEMVLKQLAEMLVRRAPQIAMIPAEHERLLAWQAAREAGEASDEAQGRTMLGESSILLTQDRFKPSDGVEV